MTLLVLAFRLLSTFHYFWLRCFTTQNRDVDSHKIISMSRMFGHRNSNCVRWNASNDSPLDTWLVLHQLINSFYHPLLMINMWWIIAWTDGNILLVSTLNINNKFNRIFDVSICIKIQLYFLLKCILWQMVNFKETIEIDPFTDTHWQFKKIQWYMKRS